jgi:hypothetical protein
MLINSILQFPLRNMQEYIWDKTIWRTLDFFAIFDIQTKLMRSLSVVMFCLYFFDFCSCRVLSKTEENTEKNSLMKVICKGQKIWHTLQIKPCIIVMLGLLQLSRNLEFVAKNFILWKVQATFSY